MILDWSRLKAFADDKIDVTEKLRFVLERVENVTGKMMSSSKFPTDLKQRKALKFNPGI